MNYLCAVLFLLQKSKCHNSSYIALECVFTPSAEDVYAACIHKHIPKICNKRNLIVY